MTAEAGGAPGRAGAGAALFVLFGEPCAQWLLTAVQLSSPEGGRAQAACRSGVLLLARRAARRQQDGPDAPALTDWPVSCGSHGAGSGGCGETAVFLR